VHGACLLYLLGLVFILVQSESNARQFLTFFYPDLGKPPVENDKIYAAGILLPCLQPSNRIGDICFAEIQIVASILLKRRTTSAT